MRVRITNLGDGEITVIDGPKTEHLGPGKTVTVHSSKIEVRDSTRKSNEADIAIR